MHESLWVPEAKRIEPLRPTTISQVTAATVLDVVDAVVMVWGPAEGIAFVKERRRHISKYLGRLGCDCFYTTIEQLCRVVHALFALKILQFSILGL